jgi:hypothetical protein
MYEGRHGAFDYTIERRLGDDGHNIWLWRVMRAGAVITSGVSPRSHHHAETVVLSFIFQVEADERRDGSVFVRTADEGRLTTGGC